MTINLNGPDSPPSIILKAEPESSESHINYMGVSFDYQLPQNFTFIPQDFADNVPQYQSSPFANISSPNQATTSSINHDIQFHVTRKNKNLLRNRFLS